MLEADASPRGMCSTCFMYLSLLFAVRNAPGLRTDVIVRYWREAVSGVPDSVRVPPGKYADEALERNAFFYDNHYRRFLVLDELTEALRQAGFRIEYAREQTGFAPYGNDDPPVIRVVAVKN